MNKICIIALYFCILSSCVIDRLQRFCVVKNQSNRKIAVYFSNSETLDTTTFSRQLSGPEFAIKENSYGDILIRNELLDKQQYKNSNKKLYVFFLDQDSIDKYLQVPLNKTVIDKSFLQRQRIDIENIQKTDTLYFNTNG